MISESIRLVKSKLHAAFSSTDQRAKIQDGDFIVGLLEATADSPESFSLASLRLSMCSFVGETIGQSAFNERMGTATLKNQVQQLALCPLILARHLMLHICLSYGGIM